MLKINKDYSDYTDESDPNYPEGKAVNTSTAESVDGTPLLDSFMNNIIGAFQGMFKKAYGSTSGINGVADNVNESQFVDAIEKYTGDKIQEHDDKRGLVDSVHGATSEAVGGQLVTRDELGSAEFSTPLSNSAAARRGDIYDLTKAVVCNTAENVFAKEIHSAKYPGFILQNEAVVRVLFQFGAKKATASITSEDVLTLNVCNTGAKKIFAKRDGAVIPLGSIVVDNSTCYFQAYTDMNMIYIESLDGGKGGWLILGNPVVMSDSSATNGYTVYADGRSVYNKQSVDNLFNNKLDDKNFNGVSKNCNDLIERGFYFNPVTSYINGPTLKSINSAGYASLQVEGINSRLIQTFTAIGMNATSSMWYTEVWQRKKIDNTWFSWHSINSYIS